MISFAEELSRIEGRGPAPNLGGLTITLNAECASGAVEALERVKDVLRAVVSVLASESEWPEVEQWSRVLPRWFVDACRPDMSREVALAWLEKWRSLSPAEQVAEEERQPWALADWLHWFAHGRDERQWRWLSATAPEQKRLQVVLEVEGLPTAYGALTWLLRAAGAVGVHEV